ncbi:MAG: tyrosine-protein phosphatase [Bacilli bacterium]|nr:tyrosine-protein phosphatase [Bacilli bacterium]
MKKQNILLSLLVVACLTGCGSGQGGNGSSKQNNDKSKIVIEDFGTLKMEAEDFDLSGWEADESYDDNIIEEANASGGKYVAAAASGSAAEAKFSFELKKFSKVVISAAYAQVESDIAKALDMSKVYHYNIETVSPLSFAEGKGTLAARSSATIWDLLPYESQDLYPGTYNVSITVKDEAPVSLASIDYIQFKTTDASIVPVDPSTITEDDIPDNDFHNLQQYKYLMDEDELKYKTYATGADLSAPRGMKLRYEELEDASKYYFQVAESEAALANATVRESTNKYYMFQNAKLSTKYYYRAATSESALASAEVKNITSTDLAPRVVNVPNILNFRDIGGWESTLVPGAKINQGLYFRCAQLDAGRGGNTTSKLDTAGLGKAAIKELGIKVDIDMRDSYNFPQGNVSAANSNDWPVTFVGAAVPSGSEPVRWEGGSYQGTDIAAQYKIIFDTLANCDTAPAMLHCTYGADRTGITTFFLEALLGMNEEDMIRDYLWTQFTQGRTVKYTESDAEFPKWLEKTKACDGSTFADKMENHLMSFGIEKSTLEHIREIFVPGYVAKA